MKFEARQIYHLYNRGNNSQQIFFDRENYIFFLQKIRTHLKPVADILAYCLMPNHFHLLFYVLEKPEGLQKTHQVASSHLMGEINSDIISKPIRVAVILRSYTQTKKSIEQDHYSNQGLRPKTQKSMPSNAFITFTNIPSDLN